MSHNAELFFIDDGNRVADPVRIHTMFRGYLRQWKIAGLFFSILGAVLVSIPFFAINMGSDKYLLWVSGGFCLLLGYGCSWFGKTDPIAHFVKSPTDFSSCPARITSAIYVPPSSHQSPSIRAFTDYNPGNGTVTIETRFDIPKWPFDYSKDGPVPLSAEAWVIYKISKPEFSFLAGIKRPDAR